MTTARPRRRRTALPWAGCVLAFFLMTTGWSLGLPANGTPDESAHAIRAYAVASGQFYAPPNSVIGGASFDVPRSLLPDNNICTFFHRPPLAATCQNPPSTDRTRVVTNTAAGRYNPVYYLLVGLPELLSPNLHGIIGARLLAGLFSAMLLGAAAAIAWTSGRPLLLAAIVLSVTPITLDLAGSLNSSGMEISAGLLCWTALLVLLQRDAHEDRPSDATLLWCAGVPAALLLTLRTLGPAFLVLTVALAVALARPGRVRSLLGQRRTRIGLAALCVVAAYGAAWTLLSGTLGVTPNRHASADSALRTLHLIVDRQLGTWVQQTVGIFSFGETVLASWVYAVWFALAGALVLPGLLLARRRPALTLVAIGVLSVATMATLEVRYLPVIGHSQQARYLMPFLVGLPLGAALVPQWQRALGDRGARRLSLCCIGVTAPLQVYALGAVMTRFERGPGQPWQPFGGGWQPALGTVAPMAAEVLGVLALLLVVASCPRAGAGAPADPADRAPGVDPLPSGVAGRR